MKNRSVFGFICFSTFFFSSFLQKYMIKKLRNHISGAVGHGGRGPVSFQKFVIWNFFV
jgi:hypothetical protein